MAIIDLMSRDRGAKYSGSNSADFVALIQEILTRSDPVHYAAAGTVNGASCEVLIKRISDDSVDGSVVVSTGNWLIFTQAGQTYLDVPDAFVTQSFRTYSEAAGVLGATQGFAESAAALGGGMGSMPSITVNGLSNANFDVPIRPMQKTNTFTAVPMLTGTSSLLGSLAITGLTSGAVSNANKLSTTINGVTWYDRVRVNVANSGALQLVGAAILVHVTP